MRRAAGAAWPLLWASHLRPPHIHHPTITTPPHKPQGPPPPAPAPGAEAAAAAAPAADGKEGKEKKKDRKGGASAGVVLGKGTTLVREFIEKAAAGGTAPALPTTPPAAPAAPEGGAAEGGDVKRGPPPLLLHGVGLEPGALVGVRDALSPLAPSTHKFLEELRAVVEANQVGQGLV